MGGFKIFLDKKIQQADNLVNESVGIMKDIIYTKDKTPSNNLPMYVIVDFSDKYNVGIFGDDQDKHGWLPIKPMISKFCM